MNGRHLPLLIDQLTDERATKNSLEQRGIAIISTSGTLVAIILGLIALATRSQVYALPRAAILLLVLALAGLVVASAAGLAINLPTRTPVIDAQELAQVADRAAWDTEDQDSRRTDYQLQAHLLINLRMTNTIRGRLLFFALLFEVLALGLMAASVSVALRALL